MAKATVEPPSEPAVNGVAKIECTFEEAVTRIGTGRFHLALLLTTGFALLGMIIEGLNMAFVLPAAKCELSISTSEQGMINAIAFLGVVLTSHFWGFMADTWGRRKVLRFSLGAGFAFSALSSVSVNSMMLLVTRFCVGLTISGVMSAAISYLGEFHCNKNRARHVTFAAMFMTISIVYQALMGLFIMPRTWEFSLFGWMVIRSWRLYILITSGTSALAFVAICLLPESPKFELAMGRPDEAVRILSRAYAANGRGRRAEDYPVARIRLETIGSNLADAKGLRGMGRMVWKQTRPLLHRDHVGNVMALCFLTFALFAVAHGFYMWYPQVLSMYYPNMAEAITVCRAVDLGFANATLTAQPVQQRAQLADVADALQCVVSGDEPLTYVILLITGLGFVSLYMFVALTSNRLGMTTLLTSWLVICVLVTIALLFTNNFHLNVALLIVMHSAGNCGSVLSAISADLFPTHFKGMALTFVMMSGRMGAVFGGNVVGALLDGHCEWTFGMFIALLCVSTVICFYVLRKKDRLGKA